MTQRPKNPTNAMLASPPERLNPDDYTLSGYEDLEISTQIILREAFLRGLRVEILDRIGHFLRISNNAGKVQYVKEASKTGLDSYISFLIMEDKEVSKLILREAGLRVPEGGRYYAVEQALAEWDAGRFAGRSMVVKPTTTNFGLGIVVYESPLGAGDREHFRRSVEQALKLSPACIVEDFAPGPEYRFLVIGDECAAVNNRVPANVRGDGSSSIAQLVAEKNADPRRGEGHRLPLEKIQLGDAELDHLSRQNLNPDSIPRGGERIYLRRNSNISTGGDSLDRTDDIHASYRAVAVAAAQSAGARICGVDLIIPDIARPADEDGAYAILEINFNPVLYIHDYPFEGKNRRVGSKVLDLLGF